MIPFCLMTAQTLVLQQMHAMFNLALPIMAQQSRIVYGDLTKRGK